MKRASISFAAICLLLLGTTFRPAFLAGQEVRQLEPFSGIGIGISADVYYTQGNTHEIKIEGNSQDVNDLITEVKEGTLKLKYEDWKKQHSKLTIYITSKDLEKVAVSGSANFRAEKSVSSDELSLVISGSGSIQFSELIGDEMEVKISGSGNAIIDKGTADELDVKISGSGKLMAEMFEVSELSAGISGSGSCKITATDEIEARISGSGSVYYHGKPQINSSTSGSGKVRAL